MSKSELKRIAAMKGEPMTTVDFHGLPVHHVDAEALLDVVATNRDTATRNKALDVARECIAAEIKEG